MKIFQYLGSFKSEISLTNYNVQAKLMNRRKQEMKDPKKALPGEKDHLMYTKLYTKFICVQ